LGQIFNSPYLKFHERPYSKETANALL